LDGAARADVASIEPYNSLTMRRHLLGLLGLWLLAASGLSASDFWTEKPFLQWSDKDAEKMISGSPWAVVSSVALPPTLPSPSGDVGGGRGGGRGDDSFGPGARRIRLTISWRSALPVKQALVRTQVGQGGTPTADQSTFLSQSEQFYVIGIVGLPPQYVRPGASTTVEAFLRRKDKADIPVQQAGSQPGAGGSSTLLLGFPRGDITPEDVEVELVAKFDRLEVKRKFKLAEMMFEGKLAL
jgi:hypothetical protein